MVVPEDIELAVDGRACKAGPDDALSIAGKPKFVKILTI